MVTRAAHIEEANGLDTEACMMAITRFMIGYGKPHRVIIDIGTNFVGAARKLKEYFNEWDSDAIGERLTLGQILRKFYPTGVPHGGVWKKPVRSCEKTMFAILGNRRLKFQC